MEYIIISMLTISLFTYIVYILANRILAVHIHIKYLILCACCALLISLILPRMLVKFTDLTGTLGIVTMFAIVSSYCIAYYYDIAMRKEVNKRISTTEDVELPEELQTDQKEDVQLTATIKEIVEINQPEHVVKITEKVEVATNPVVKAYSYPVKNQKQNKSLVSLVVNNALPQHDVENVSANIVENTEVLAEPIAKEYRYPVPYKEWDKPSIFLETDKVPRENQSEDLPIETTREQQEISNFLNFNTQTDITNDPLLLKTIQEHLHSPNSQELSVSYEKVLDANETDLESETERSSDVSQQSTTVQDDVLLENFVQDIIVEDSSLSSNDLDVLMDLAFSQKEQRNFLEALTTFRRALILFPNSEAAPFLVMEIGTILKNMGSYNEAIQIFVEGRLLHGVMDNKMLEQEFINNIAYLRVVKNILIQNSLEFMPFNRIPENIFKEIDVAFYEWRNQS